jgi:hypothetical protein
LIRIRQARSPEPRNKKTRDKFLTACYVLSIATQCPVPVIFLSRGHFMLKAQVIYSDVFRQAVGDKTMDDYQEELLEYQAFELDPLEPAEDATEL